MIEVQPCCAATREDLRDAHKRVASLTFQLMLLAAQVVDLIETRAAEQEAHAREIKRWKQTVEHLERERDDAYADLAEARGKAA